MRIRHIHVASFKRFSDLTITELPGTARLVVLVGSNGSGKSSLFDAFKDYHLDYTQLGGNRDVAYHFKQGLPPRDWGAHTTIEFHEPIPAGLEERRKMFYFRSAYRNDPDFTITSFKKIPPALESQPVHRMIENDVRVSENYQRLVSITVDGIYGGRHDHLSVPELREEVIGEVRNSMLRMFPDLILQGMGRPMENGTFFFDKGMSNRFHYKNLSGGEESALDIVVDIIVKRNDYDDTVYCIDEPDLHMHTKLQGTFLRELFGLVPKNCQLWITTHSIGMMRTAQDLQEAHSGAVVFLDFDGKDFDQPVTMAPASVDREFWKRTLHVALDDLADLVAPRRVVLCEGSPGKAGSSARAQLDAECFKVVFGGTFSDTDFLSVGNDKDVISDRLHVGQSIQTLVPGTELIRVIDHDDRSDEQVNELNKVGVRVLSRRHLEAYLMDEEILANLCRMKGKEDRTTAVLEARTAALDASVKNGNSPDDVKSAAGQIYNETKRILQLTRCGNDTPSFLRDTLAHCVTPDTVVYEELRRDIFGT